MSPQPRMAGGGRVGLTGTADPNVPPDWRSSDAIEVDGYASRNIGMVPFNGGRGGSRKVGWTIQHGREAPQSYEFVLNPQSVQRLDSSRSQVYPTKSGFYVDSFGAGPVQITVTQLVASGKTVTLPRGGTVNATMRQDVLAFYEGLYLPSVRANAASRTPRISFFDADFYDATFSQMPEPVYFPPQSWQLMRAVSLHNVWQLTITMSTLRAPVAKRSAHKVAGAPTQSQAYTVRAGDTLHKIAVRLAGRSSTAKRVKAITDRIVALNKGSDDISKTRTIEVSQAGGSVVGSVTVKRLQVYPGERIWLPTSG